MTSKSISFSQVPLALVVVILIAASAKGSAATSPFCKKCYRGDDTPAQCELLVKGASTWDEALTNVVNSILKELNKTKPILNNLPSKLPHGLLPQTIESLDSTCKEVFDSIDDDLHKVLDQIKNGDPEKSIPTELSAVSTFVSDCTDALEECEVEIPELSNIGNVMRKYASVSLSITELKYSYP